MVLKQIFKEKVPILILYNLLENISDKNENNYTFDLNSYKKMLYHNYQTEFFNEIIKYYHESKKFYINRALTYNSFTNILRQICKNNNITYTTKIKYIESEYNIVYYIIYPIPVIEQVEEKIEEKV